MAQRMKSAPASRLRGTPSYLVLASALALSPVAAAPAFAQDAPVAQLEEVVVTARKRTEDLQETPISITALTGQALDDRQVASTQAIERVAPNVIATQGQGVSGNSSAGAYFIRGIGQIDFLLNTDPGVGLYVDGVYVARSIGSVLDLIDVERIEVLRGPQGTLFGRNTIGGAISVVSQPPSDSLSVDARATLGSYSRHEGRLVVSGPLADGLSGKVAVMARERNGWVKRITDGSRLGDEQSFAVRGSLRWRPTDTFTADVAVDYLDQDGTSPPANVVQIVETANFPSFHNGALVGPPCVPPPGSRTDPRCFNSQYEAGDLYRERGTFQSKQTLEVFGGSANLSWDVSDNLTIRSITGYRETKALGNRDGDHTPILIQNTTDTYEHDQFSQELQLVGTAFEDRLKWIIGGYYFTEEGTNLNFVTFPVVAIRSGGSVDNENFALFGQGTFDITDKLSLTVGARYTDETKTFLPDQIVLADPTGSFPPGSVPGFRLVPNVESSRSISEFTPMVNAAYQWSDQLMTYVNYSEGFKSGGFTQRIFPPLPAPPPFDPEFVSSYEAGFKYDTPDRRIRLNGAVYYTDYDDLQIQVLVGVQPLTANAGGARIKGFELELQAVPVDDLRINIGIGHTDAEYRQLDPTVLATGVGLDSKFAQVPAWTANFGASYELRLAGGSLTPRVDVSYRSESYMNSANTESLRQDGYALVNASVTYEPEGQPWRVTLFAQNITDQAYINGGFADLIDQGYAEAAVGRPREVGVTFNYRY